MKKKFIDAHMKVAEIYSQLSSAKRLKVGAVLVKEHTIIGIGYNGMPSGWSNECEDIQYLENGTKILTTKEDVIHAESNCILKVARSTNSTEDSVMFVTHAPCIDCAKLIYQAGVRKVFYRNVYRNENGLDFLRKCDIELEQI